MIYHRYDSENFFVSEFGCELLRNTGRVTIYSDAVEDIREHVATNVIGVGHVWPANTIESSKAVYVNGVKVTYTHAGQIIQPEDGLTIGDVVHVYSVSGTQEYWINAGTETHSFNASEYIENQAGRAHIKSLQLVRTPNT